MACFSTKQ